MAISKVRPLAESPLPHRVVFSLASAKLSSPRGRSAPWVLRSAFEAPFVAGSDDPAVIDEPVQQSLGYYIAKSTRPFGDRQV
tara:strand:- start:50 stop:295 length:246 start_codon:yes stop_codon:yes gene_type:complete